MKGAFGKQKGKKTHFQQNNGARPNQVKAYIIPHSYENLVNKDVGRLEGLGIIGKSRNVSERGATCFIIPNKKTTYIFITYFRELNKCTEIHKCPMKNIQDISESIRGFHWVTILEPRIGSYVVGLDGSPQFILYDNIDMGQVASSQPNIRSMHHG